MNIGNDKWRVNVHPDGLYVTLRFAVSRHDQPRRDAVGFVIKRASRMLYTERNGGYRHALRLGPIYVRTFARKR